MIVFSKDSLRASVEAATGGRVTVLYDDKGYPSYMVRIPAFNVEDVAADLGTGLHPAFIVDGVEKSEIFIGQYPALVKEGRAVSLPGVDPTASVNYDTASGYCTAKGVGWHLMTNWEWAAIALLCIKNGFQPRGNTNYGRAYDQTHETGVRQDAGIPGDTDGTARTLTGSGPVTWRHDNTHAGICELVGNVWEWVGGLKTVSGKFYLQQDNNFNAAEGDWIDSGVIITDDAGTTKLGVDGTDALKPTGNTYFGAWKGLTSTAAYQVSVSDKQRMMQALIDPTFNNSNPVGGLWYDTDGEKFPIRGGSWSDAANAGVSALNLNNARSDASTHIGFRPAFVS
ncbi:SUMF1/EgtB/PvdO family nonheme iron enzyme [Maridesulfovibrio bastinii]|uniref:SUMF1/EgtB/PvdO family nonheme iron enzyme n=1 Tax=Maridesulfovibrio bastinii TaxID=47157 RepID=UPI00040BF754|nr:SUMF1/EgtB/PvdO family nonheme iron enzyme [Maridesulfovibrio bastinii]